MVIVMVMVMAMDGARAHHDDHRHGAVSSPGSLSFRDLHTYYSINIIPYWSYSYTPSLGLVPARKTIRIFIFIHLHSRRR